MESLLHYFILLSHVASLFCSNLSLKDLNSECSLVFQFQRAANKLL